MNFRNSQWKSWETPKITFRTIKNVNTLPECFAKIADQGFINSDFIFCHGGIVTNIDMSSYISFHKYVFFFFKFVHFYYSLINYLVRLKI